MGGQVSALRFVWWNVQDFGHYDPALAGKAPPHWGHEMSLP